MFFPRRRGVCYAMCYASVCWSALKISKRRRRRGREEGALVGREGCKGEAAKSSSGKEEREERGTVRE